jgi:hypothetical protein
MVAFWPAKGGCHATFSGHQPLAFSQATEAALIWRYGCGQPHAVLVLACARAIPGRPTDAATRPAQMLRLFIPFSSCKSKENGNEE